MPALRKTKRQAQEEALRAAFHIALYEKGWTVKHLGELMKVERSQASKLINYPFSHSFERIWTVAEKLNVDIDETLRAAARKWSA